MNCLVFFINLVLTILGWLPGVFHAWYVPFLRLIDELENQFGQVHCLKISGGISVIVEGLRSFGLQTLQILLNNVIDQT